MTVVQMLHISNVANNVVNKHMHTVMHSIMYHLVIQEQSRHMLALLYDCLLVQGSVGSITICSLRRHQQISFTMLLLPCNCDGIGAAIHQHWGQLTAFA